MERMEALQGGYFNPRSPRGERRCDTASKIGVGISIHAPREGSDVAEVRHGHWVFISIHAPREGSDANIRADLAAGLDFNPRSPRGERLSITNPKTLNLFISIHAPREGSDVSCMLPHFGFVISIHAPREGSDIGGSNILRWDEGFQSTLPARGATAGMSFQFHDVVFQSTLPARGATMAADGSIIIDTISIHAPREGSDSRRQRQSCRLADFNPRSPRGERRERSS